MIIWTVSLAVSGPNDYLKVIIVQDFILKKINLQILHQRAVQTSFKRNAAVKVKCSEV